MLLREDKQGYSLSRSQSDKINHLLYIDNLKLFGKTNNDLESLVQAPRIYTEDIRIQFRAEKCATFVIKREKVKKTMVYGCLMER